MINVCEIASHKLVPMTQDIRGMGTTCALSMKIVRAIIKDWFQTPKAGIKIMLVFYHLTKSKVAVTGLVVHVSDLPISFLYVVKKESSITEECGTIPVGKNLFNFNKITTTIYYNVIFSTFEQVFAHCDYIPLIILVIKLP